MLQSTSYASAAIIWRNASHLDIHHIVHQGRAEAEQAEAFRLSKNRNTNSALVQYKLVFNDTIEVLFNPAAAFNFVVGVRPWSGACENHRNAL